MIIQYLYIKQTGSLVNNNFTLFASLAMANDDCNEKWGIPLVKHIKLSPLIESQKSEVKLGFDTLFQEMDQKRADKKKKNWKNKQTNKFTTKNGSFYFQHKKIVQFKYGH